MFYLQLWSRNWYATCVFNRQWSGAPDKMHGVLLFDCFHLKWLKQNKKLSNSGSMLCEFHRFGGSCSTMKYVVHIMIHHKPPRPHTSGHQAAFECTETMSKHGRVSRCLVTAFVVEGDCLSIMSVPLKPTDYGHITSTPLCTYSLLRFISDRWISVSAVQNGRQA
jgi:hypothetical protein